MRETTYTVKITFTNGDVEHYMSNTTDIELILPEFEIENVKFVEISNNINVQTNYEQAKII